MLEKKISIIVPIYGVEQYLEECICSLLKQTYRNLEIILIDDGSKDACPEICDQYQKTDERITVIHKKNGGAASARNVGLDIASGDYIGFVDSDDYVDPKYIEQLYVYMQENDADISVCSFFNVYKRHKEAVEIKRTGSFGGEEYLKLFLNDWRCGLIWNKLFKADVVKKIRFSEGHVIDDEFFTYQAVMRSDKIMVCSEPLYYYRMRASGVMNQRKYSKMLQDRLQYMQERFENVTLKHPNLYKLYLENLADNLIRFRSEAVLYKDIVENVKQVQKKYLVKILSGPLDIRMKYAYVHSMLRNGKNSGMATVESNNREEYFE